MLVLGTIGQMWQVGEKVYYVPNNGTEMIHKGTVAQNGKYICFKYQVGLDDETNEYTYAHRPVSKGGMGGQIFRTEREALTYKAEVCRKLSRYYREEARKLDERAASLPRD